jgi:AP-3 complex subunit mu
MSAIEALYIFDRFAPTATIVLQHEWRSRSPTSAASLLAHYNAHPAPRPALLYIPTTTPPTLLFSHEHNNLLLLSPSTSEIEPLLVLEFLHRVVDVLEDYLGSPLLTAKIESNYDVVAQLLSEMADDGIPFTTEPNALRDVVLPPSLMGKLFGSVTGLPGYPRPRTFVQPLRTD